MLSPAGADADAEEPLQGGADRARAEAGGDRNAGHRNVAGDGVSDQTYYRWKKRYGVSG